MPPQHSLQALIPATLGHADIARRIPHHGSMCLLDRVTAWDGEHIFCEAASHMAIDNPLRAYGRLGAACGVEYAAQAMAVHGALIAESESARDAASGSAGGYLVSLRSVHLKVERLDDLEGALLIRAQRLSGASGTIHYSFTAYSAPMPDKPLLSGRAIVLLNAAPAASPFFSAIS